jgi:putative oxidoreductase
MNSTTFNNSAMLAGRAMLAAMFIIAGFNKVGAYAGTQAYMESVGLPGMLLPAVIVLEVLGGLAILIGFQTRIAAALLAGFTVLAAIIFHSDFSQPMQSILFTKNIAIAGAFLLLVAQGPGQWAIKPRAPTRANPAVKNSATA